MSWKSAMKSNTTSEESRLMKQSYFEGKNAVKYDIKLSNKSKVEDNRAFVA